MNELKAPRTKGHLTVVRLPDWWYVACLSSELEDRPIARTVLGTPLVLFRGEGGRAAALLDRCAHRNVPLSGGTCEARRLVCPYHGWEYDEEGVVQRVPALAGIQTGKARRVPSYRVIEQQGLVWITLAEGEPKSAPYELQHLADPSYSSVRYHAPMEATLHATCENILDVPHTAFLHRGLFRGGRQNSITAVVRKGTDRVEAQYVGEPRPTGVIGRVLAPGGGTVDHFDRFILPSIAQVEYRLGENHIIVTNLLTPVSDFVTMLYAIVVYKLRVPHAVVKAVLVPLAKKVVAQDAVILKAQSDAVQRFGGEQFVSTDVDLLGPHILRLLRQAERDELSEEPDSTEQRVELLA